MGKWGKMKGNEFFICMLLIFRNDNQKGVDTKVPTISQDPSLFEYEDVAAI